MSNYVLFYKKIEIGDILQSFPVIVGNIVSKLGEHGNEIYHACSKTCLESWTNITINIIDKKTIKRNFIESL